MTVRIAVAAPGTGAAEAAEEVARAGGNAVDAAVAAVVAASCTEPGIMSPMGGAFVNVWEPGASPVVLDGNCEMPGRGCPPEHLGTGTWAATMDYAGGLTVFGGPGSVATPGMFAALDEASTRWGVLPWAELLAPTVDVLRRGYRLGATSAYYLGYATAELFARDEGTAAFLGQTGGPPTTGALLRDPDLAATLERVGRHGAEDLYTGELGHALAEDMAARGGLVSMRDLSAYRTVTRPALRSRLGRWDVAVNPPPSIGGPVLTAMLRLLQSRRAQQGVTDAGDVIEIQRLVLSYRHRLIDVSDDLEDAGRELVRVVDELGPDGLAAVASSQDTIHVSTVDSNGLACAVTASAGYGSGVTVPGTGLALNNGLGEPELNRRGLHALPPGARLASNMAPATARRDDGAMVAIGSPGADRITTALFQVLGGLCLDELALQAAVDQPRLHVDLQDGGLCVRYERSEPLAEAVAGISLPVVPHEPLTMYFGGVGAALCDGEGRLSAAADPRRVSAAVVTPGTEF
ncbi:gamma-glutamyltranspeptidase / glutathione hydrolase [Austwickia chelonae]|uniref:Gamma-glutamyltranspeptidase n=1 Tax=Austwickia chelonae NBRC 105200 TaxID=1184607 RepID=K6UKU2_9MICO|nr:gamma-glutamyltransferase [Austwickia chelonae]GAB76691.1 gamma-glutamyltranspeptidase [Austwickia chelonae NBRC 105200]SEW29340.1 gamma-glutamyltranspeptidase / glutathione hydrolase [Austwickia chelonae]